MNNDYRFKYTRDIKFCLNLCLNGNTEKTKGFLSACLKLLSPSDGSEVLVKLRMCVLNAKPGKTFDSKFSEGQPIKSNKSFGFYKLLPTEFLFDEVNSFLQDDKLKFFCEVRFLSDGINISSINQFKIAERNLGDDFGNLLDNHKFSDVTRVVDNHKFPAHKAVLASRSDVFAAMFQYEMKESKLNLVTISDFEHDVFKEMLGFIYTDGAPKLKEMAHQLLAAADKYALTKLKVMAEEAIFGELSIETAAETLVIADLHSTDQLKEKTIHFIKMNAKEIIKTNGWQNLIKNYSYLISETLEALLTPTKGNKLHSSINKLINK